MRIRNATTADLGAVKNLLTENDLPTEGVAENFVDFIVAEDGNDIAGAIGIERFGNFALLRSAVVAIDRRGAGLGTQLVEQILDRAGEAGVSDLFLLTTTAEDYFPKFGFMISDRDAVPDSVKESAEFRGACPDTAVVMARRMADRSRV